MEREKGVVVENFFTNKQSIALMGFAALSAVRFLGVRDFIPEPFDIFDHIGNSAVSFVLMRLAGKRYWKPHLGKEGQAELLVNEIITRESRMKKYAFIASTGLNLGAELIGYGSISTPDPIDFAYGIPGGYYGFLSSSPKVRILPKEKRQERPPRRDKRRKRRRK